MRVNLFFFWPAIKTDAFRPDSMESGSFASVGCRVRLVGTRNRLFKGNVRFETHSILFQCSVPFDSFQFSAGGPATVALGRPVDRNLSFRNDFRPRKFKPTEPGAGVGVHFDFDSHYTTKGLDWINRTRSEKKWTVQAQKKGAAGLFFFFYRRQRRWRCRSW